MDPSFVTTICALEVSVLAVIYYAFKKPVNDVNCECLFDFINPENLEKTPIEFIIIFDSHQFLRLRGFPLYDALRNLKQIISDMRSSIFESLIQDVEKDFTKFFENCHFLVLSYGDSNKFTVLELLKEINEFLQDSEDERIIAQILCALDKRFIEVYEYEDLWKVCVEILKKCGKDHCLLINTTKS